MSFYTIEIVVFDPVFFGGFCRLAQLISGLNHFGCEAIKIWFLYNEYNGSVEVRFTMTIME